MKIDLAILVFATARAHLAQAHGHDHGFLHRRATTTTDSVSALSSPDKPTLTGTISNCNQWYDVVSGDSCWSISQAFGITQAQFQAWNTAVGDSCIVEIGVSYCVGVGQAVSTSTTPSTAASSTASTSSIGSSTVISTGTITANSTSATPYSTLSYNTTTNPVTITNSTWPPSQTQIGQPSYCDNWYQAKQGDTCKSIVFRYSTWMDQEDFLDWNPAVGENCTSIYFGYWYCVGIKPQVSNYDNGTTAAWYPTWTYTVPVATDTDFLPSPTQSGIATGCQDYYIADETDTCAGIVSSEGFLTEDQFIEWNPANGTSLPMPSTTTVLPSPVQTGITSSCTAWYLASDGDDCDLIPEEFGTFSKSDFLNWNPAVQSDCSGLVIGDYYCVAIPDTPTTRTASLTALPTPTTPSDTISDCADYWLVGTNDNCTAIASTNGISVTNLEAWNPSLGPDCSGLTADTYICVAAPRNTSTSSTSSSISSGSTITPPSSTPAQTSATATSAGASPSPVQTGMVSGCIRFYKVEDGNDCYDIAQEAGVALADLYSWNPALNGDCSGLQSGVFVCIGVSGYATTITTGTPVPVTPTPTQTGMVSGCLRFYDVQSGEGCADIASEAGVAQTDFYNWNPAVSTNCAGLQASVFVCIGTTGPITTITSGTPVPVTSKS
ncbi:uncharacterized protein N7443_000242 [Penicillium atrosanguineum]|uniref:uncharacterized protein n=1 Tax=Penicillium atrosanguineum TaxID=1132637 RepID=UPI002386BE9B|nr:uncharacterized protein N7443_000242 [Penicillium atrosanguineum]KAJ5313358.1 hypothetical protein N7443_000242 [Penicillium atrosanguineum]